MSSAPHKILVLFAHPALERSRVQRRLAAVAQRVEGVTFHDLYEVYPSLDIDVAREQALLSAHDVIVFQHPFYWYSVPALLKQWQDLVLTHGWAYGATGRALAGKVTLNALSSGGSAAAYQPGGANRFTIRQLLAPWDQTAHLCRMRFLAPYVVFGALKLSTDADLGPACEGYRWVLTALRDGTLDLDAASAARCLNDVLPPQLAAASCASDPAPAVTPEPPPHHADAPRHAEPK